ncbi:MAG TPA: TrkH family potassium uptake protein [Afifellaceae bacterium]|nr:TrkH family potassium uptake protein [Afifellaceae bacterium]
MLDFRPIILVLGILIAVLGVAMLVPALVDLALGEPTAGVFAGAAALSTATGLALWSASRGTGTALNARQAALMTTGAWSLLAGFGALPLYWSGITPQFTDAYFEAMSGITTTGSTVIVGLDHLPTGILLWRSMLQWLGGLGVVVMAIAVLPMLHVGGMQLFKAEAFDVPEKILPRATDIAGGLILVYVVLTAVCALLYAAAGMEGWDAVIHAMTTVATGGYSSHDASFGYFESNEIEVIATIFMVLGSVPFLLFVQATRGRLGPLWRDQQVRAMLLTLGFATLIIWVYMDIVGLQPGADGLVRAAFNTVSIMTGTGYASTDFEAWGPFATGFFFILMFIGGCSSSTSCGIKIFRFQVLFQELRQQTNQLIWPDGVFIKRFNRRPLPDTVASAVMSFFFLYIGVFLLLAMALSLTGLDALTALSGAATAISNVGPGLGPVIGPAGNFAPLSDTAKWLLCAGMLLGRLELFTVLVLLVPAFWRT